MVGSSVLLTLGLFTAVLFCVYVSSEDIIEMARIIVVIKF